MAQETNQSPVLCAMGCGFYGNPRTSGMCSVCYKEHLQRQQSSGRISPMGTSSVSNSPTSEASAIQRIEASLSNSEAISASMSDISRGVPAASLPVTQQMTEMSISREENVTTPKAEAAEPGFGCRCGNLFCGLHRYSDQHNCPYDYKAEAAEKIRKENPVVVADKIQRI
ncbi:UNVERIFIED_CONTAM: hypothetical protein FKN15_017681 [Acipenser sinensis]